MTRKGRSAESRKRSALKRSAARAKGAARHRLRTPGEIKEGGAGGLATGALRVAQKLQSSAARTYVTKDAARSAAAKKAAATRKANAEKARRSASRRGFGTGVGMGAAGGAAVSYATTKATEGPKRSMPRNSGGTRRRSR